jgi:hypothetical protein
MHRVLLALAIACSEPAPPREVEAEPRVPPVQEPAAPIAPEPPPPRPAPLARGEAIVAPRIDVEPAIDGCLDEWTQAQPVPIDQDWRGGAEVPETIAYFAWTDDALFVAFECAYEGELSLSDAPYGEVTDLYRYDVVELFVDPTPDTPDTYLEIEVDPRGRYLDIDVDRSRRPRGDVAWSSGITASATVTDDRFFVEARIPAAAFGSDTLTPTEWRANVYRIAGTSPDRTFLARYPTMTERPNFHVPERFGTMLLR